MYPTQQQPQPFYPAPPPPRHRRRGLHPAAIAGIIAGGVLIGMCAIGTIAVAVSGDYGTPAAAPATTSSAPPATTEPAPEPTPEPEPEPVDEVTDDEVMEQLFVQLIRDEYPAEFDTIPDETLVDLGHTRCDEIEDEGLEDLMIRLAVDPDVDPEIAGFFTGASIQAFCPQHMDELEEIAS